MMDGPKGLHDTWTMIKDTGLLILILTWRNMCLKMQNSTVFLKLEMFLNFGSKDFVRDIFYVLQ